MQGLFSGHSVWPCFQVLKLMSFGRHCPILSLPECLVLQFSLSQECYYWCLILCLQIQLVWLSNTIRFNLKGSTSFVSWQGCGGFILVSYMFKFMSKSSPSVLSSAYVWSASAILKSEFLASFEFLTDVSLGHSLAKWSYLLHL